LEFGGCGPSPARVVQKAAREGDQVGFLVDQNGFGMCGLGDP